MPTHASQVRDYTPPARVVLQGRGPRGEQSVAEINAEQDPFTALARAVEYLRSVLRPASHRDAPAAWGWCWATVHILDALAAAVQRGEHPDPWFRDQGNWHLEPAGWAPIRPVTVTYRTLSRRPGEETR